MRDIWGSARTATSRTHTRPSGHPARGRFRLRQVSWLAGRRIHLTFPKPDGFSGYRADARRSQLRGQLRHCSACHRHHAPYSRLSFRRESEEPRTLDIVDDMKFPSTTMMFEFRKVWGLFGADINGRAGPTLAPSIATSKWGRLPNCRLVPLVR
jgi:hypothetical protein